MKRHNLFFLLAMASLSSVGCRKADNVPFGVTAINVIHALYDVPSIAINFSDTSIPFYLNKSFISYGSSGEYGVQSGLNSVNIISSADSTKLLYQGKLNLRMGVVYSLYLSGLSSHIDTMLLEDQLPTHVDSAAGVRFINLISGSEPVSINLEGNDPNQTEFGNIGYKHLTVFRSYPVNIDNSGFVFEVRNATTDSLLSSFNWTPTMSKNYTLLVSGSLTAGIEISQVNNF